MLITIDYNNFKKAFIGAKKKAYNASIGFRFALFLEEDGEITISNMITQNTSQQEAIEIYTVDAYQQDQLLDSEYYNWKNYTNDELEKIAAANLIKINNYEYQDIPDILDQFDNISIPEEVIDFDDLFENYFEDQIINAFKKAVYNLNHMK